MLDQKQHILVYYPHWCHNCPSAAKKERKNGLPCFSCSCIKPEVQDFHFYVKGQQALPLSRALPVFRKHKVVVDDLLPAASRSLQLALVAGLGHTQAATASIPFASWLGQEVALRLLSCRARSLHLLPRWSSLKHFTKSKFCGEGDTGEAAANSAPLCLFLFHKSAVQIKKNLLKHTHCCTW